MKPKSFIEKIIHNPIIQTFVVYISGGWIVLELTDYIINKYSLSEKISDVLPIILLSGLPVAIILAWYLSRKQDDIEESSSIQESGQSKKLVSLKRWKLLLPGILILIAIGITIGFRISHKYKSTFALNVALPELKNVFAQLSQTDGEWNWMAYHQSLELRRILRNNPDFIQLWNDITTPLSINTDPLGAKVFAKPYSRPDTSWCYLGETPITDFPFPRGLSRIKIEKTGFETEYDIILIPVGWEESINSRHYQLFSPNEKPKEMVYVQGFMGDYRKTPTLPNLYIGDFWIDRYEVTNKQYKTFIDSGGYINPDYWKFYFMEGEDTLKFEEAIDRFKDNTGWTGPANWELGDYPKSEDNLPVTGISWYEAAAYAKFVNKELPTIFHWEYVSEAHAAAEIVKFGNFDKKGPVETGTYNSLTRCGTYDLPGNVSEWILNSSGNNRIITGGNWREPSYYYNDRLDVSPWTRSELVGFRCIRYINDTLKNELSQSLNNELSPSITKTNRDFNNAKPVSDEIFDIYLDMFNYEKEKLNPRSISINETEEWIQEIISVDVPYEDAPLKIFIFLPLDYKAPYQSIIYFPGKDALYSYSLADMKVDNFDFFLKSGRAVIWPLYYATYGRGEKKQINVYTWKQVVQYIMIDVQIVCDYLQTRNDLDSERIAYYGVSWGGYMAPYILSIEDRIKIGILALFGVISSDKYHEMDQINYLPRVKIPILLMDGRYDFTFPLNQQQAFYDFLGTPESDKEWKLYESTHFIPRKDLINESLNWLDKYFGPVNK
jgi:dienelactone hydrolase